MAVEDDRPEVPARLAEDLRSLYAHDAPIPDRIDRRLRTMARFRVTGRRWELRLRRVAAACVLVMAGLATLHFATPDADLATKSEIADGTTLKPGDIDGDGRVDVVDVLDLALKVRDGGTDDRMDLDGDGLVTEADVHRLVGDVVRIR